MKQLGKVLFTASQFAWCPALNETPAQVFKLSSLSYVTQTSEPYRRIGRKRESKSLLVTLTDNFEKSNYKLNSMGEIIQPCRTPFW